MELIKSINPKLLPSLLCVIDVAAAIVYATNGMTEWRRVVYWMAAAALTYVVTW
jgi:hypothetical protein